MVNMAKSLVVLAILMAFAWLNSNASANGFSASRGFPFAFETWTDVIPSTRIHLWALTTDAALALGLLALTLRVWPQTGPSLIESIVLVTFALGFLWANSQMWFGTEHMLRKAPWIDRGSEIVVYGFPFAYHTLIPKNALHRWALVANLVIGAIGVLMIQHVFRNVDRRKLPSTTLQTDERRTSV